MSYGRYGLEEDPRRNYAEWMEQPIGDPLREYIPPRRSLPRRTVAADWRECDAGVSGRVRNDLLYQARTGERPLHLCPEHIRGLEYVERIGLRVQDGIPSTRLPLCAD